MRGAPAAAAPTFILDAPDRRLAACGLARRLAPGGAATLGARVRGFFAALPEDPAPRLLVGALPFDRDAADHIYQPERLAPDLPARRGQAGPLPHFSAPADTGVDAYKDSVRAALALLDRSALRKVVLARSIVMTADREIDALDLAARLSGDPQAAPFVTPLSPGRYGERRTLVGASPELLVARAGDAVISQPLAGSRPRRRGETSSGETARMLLRSDKDHREHALVVEAILDTLAPLCRELAAPREPALLATHTMWHLVSRIEGRLARPDETTAADLAAMLHPTPAVAGTPRDLAVDAIHRLEAHDRGFYAGAVGWAAENGDGAWRVSLRCAEIAGREMRLYAGAGILAGSDPEAEAQETSAKLRTMLQALGVDEHGRSVDWTAQ